MCNTEIRIDSCDSDGEWQDYLQSIVRDGLSIKVTPQILVTKKDRPVKSLKIIKKASSAGGTEKGPLCPE